LLDEGHQRPSPSQARELAGVSGNLAAGHRLGRSSEIGVLTEASTASLAGEVQRKIAMHVMAPTQAAALKSDGH